MNRWRSHSGSSVAEVLSVFGITAVVMAIAVPSLSALRQETSLYSVQREVMSALYLGRSGAIANNAARSVVITPPRLIQIQSRDGTTTYYRRDLSGYGSALSVTGSDSNSSDPITITFDARGLLTPATAASLTISNGLGQAKKVTVSPTGRAVAG